ncbi:hypothetical protein A9264_03030 [Vibrio sp. UCD-FRSSP16_10]|uniref:succinylglutamate desuccinylase n=1 Tax=unclassified Vibrio TaxID=2614977 RepID=UPI0007FE7C6B|nr:MULTISPECIES: succinylglutamate desuccinylase [unclassified Vibrio]OBT12129.1 hypothetical protein A9260_04480 [Vibrio sp. UCD-FRSSP16_30]OBT20460.1 hypothetical protein A9264_03030 [Vibrio sp. UCD-FRSSP16_10]
MAKALFETSFLQDTLHASEIIPQQRTLQNGVTVDVVQRGVIKVSPAHLSENAVISDKDQQKYLVLSSAIHGNETAPIEIIDDIVTQILKQTLTPAHHLLLIIAHPQAILAKQRFIDTNLNRLFADCNYAPSIESDLADSLKVSVSQFWEDVPIKARWHLDMHCSIRASQHYTFAISPHSAYPTRNEAFIEFLQQGQIEALLLSDEPSSTFSWFSASYFGAQSATVELGQVAEFGHNDMQRLSKFQTALINFIQDHATTNRYPMTTYQVSRSIYRQHQDFEFYFDKALPNFSSFALGEALGKSGTQTLLMDVEQGCVVFPNPNVELTQRAALIVQPCATQYVNHQLMIRSTST